MNYFLGFVAGGGLVALVMFTAKKGFPEYAGIVMTFPVVALLSILFSEPASLMRLSGWGILGAVALLFFLGTFTLFISFLGVDRKYFSLAAGSIVWLVAILVASIFLKY
ncbi:MAG: hypothetical protein HY954_03910 [Deltaproteobacteria bacterium]|nr:hypothetical protein [Deltaproteobacteria bacterium]